MIKSFPTYLNYHSISKDKSNDIVNLVIHSQINSIKIEIPLEILKRNCAIKKMRNNLKFVQHDILSFTFFSFSKSFLVTSLLASVWFL